MKKKPEQMAEPSLEEIQEELQRVKYKSRYRAALKGTVYTLIVVAAIAVLVATLWLPFLRIYGASMTPTLQDGEVICCLTTKRYEPGDIIAFYYNNKILVKRVIGLPGDWINIDEEGNVFVNDVPLDEPYLSEKALGECDIELPYQVPESTLFVMGDHRTTSVDSRSSTVGCISKDEVVGVIWLRLWPLDDLTFF